MSKILKIGDENMRKNILILVLCLMVLFISACNKQTGNMVKEDVVAPEEVSIDIEEEQDNSLEKRIQQIKKEFPGVDVPTTNIYVNEECGYKFEFPEGWIGSYFVDDTDPECAVVRFYGKSIRGTILEKTFSEDYQYGLIMFFIMSEETANNGTYDSVTLIGEAQGINYYFATTTDVSLAPLFNDGQYWFDEFENEQQLMGNDCEKVKEMMTFYNYENIENLLNAFEEL